ncbi:MAG: transposase family protein [Rhodobacteraceae bacterium]|nr:transposase family protein [Paracoccaceae bacterium]
MQRKILRQERAREKQRTEELNLVHYLHQIVTQQFPDLLEKLRSMEDFRKRPDYDLAEILMASMAMFLLKMGSRNAFRNQQNEREFRRNFEKLFGVRLPHPDTCERVMRQLSEPQLEKLKTDLVRGLIRKKRFDRFRYQGYFLVAVDATGVMSFHQEPDAQALHKTSKNGKTTWSYQVLEAKLVTANGFAISLMSQWLENPEDGEYDKQDCEQKAFKRLAKKLKQAFPQLRICILADGLYPNEPYFEICRQNHWRFIVTFKPGNLPTLWEEIEALLKLSSKNRRIETRIQAGKGGTKSTVSEFQWLNDIDYRGHSVNWIECKETITHADTHHSETKTFVHLTDLPITYEEASRISSNGRLRWKIENEGFNVQKNQDYELQHKYSRVSYRATKNYYQCLQLAHLINQLMVLSREFQKQLTGKMTIRHLWKRLVTSITCDVIDPSDLLQAVQQPVQIRFVS